LLVDYTKNYPDDDISGYFFTMSNIVLVYSGKSLIYSISIEGTGNMKYNKHNETETLKKHTEGSAKNGRILGFHLRKIRMSRQLCRNRFLFAENEKIIRILKHPDIFCLEQYYSCLLRKKFRLLHID